MKAGYVALIGRPNSGKSTLLNNILGHKVSITSPKPQTTRIPIQAVLNDARGQIIFIDTPGVFAKVKDPVSKKINPIASNILSGEIDVVIHLVDHTRDKDLEENKILGLIRQISKPKILAINKIDIKSPSFIPHYTFLKDEYDKIVEISALYKSNLNRLIEAIFDLLPEKDQLIIENQLPTPALNIDSKLFIAEIIREKAYLFLRKELPYSLIAIVDDISPRKNKTIYIQARIITTSSRYKKMIIGENGRMIKEIGRAARKELETATNQKIYLDLIVVVDPHWYETYL